MRLVVTGQVEAGSSIVEDTDIAQTVVDPLLMSRMLWTADDRPRLPTDGHRAVAAGAFPSVDGYRFMTLTIAAGATSREASPALRMHTTDSVDFGVVLSGTIVLELDNGVSTALRPGEAFVQNGTTHRWSNPGTEPATMAIVLVGARREVAEATAPTTGPTDVA